jgi:hypothetical protein
VNPVDAVDRPAVPRVGVQVLAPEKAGFCCERSGARLTFDGTLLERLVPLL